MSQAVKRLIGVLIGLMPSPYQKQNIQAALALFLEAQGKPLPAHTQIKSPSALSRFYNVYLWSVRKDIRSVHKAALEQLLSLAGAGRRPVLRAILDLTSLEKRGKFKALSGLLHVLNGKRGMHLVVLYLEIGSFRIPWSFRVWRGKGALSPAMLGLKLLRTLPVSLKSRYKILVLADAGFESVDFLQGVRKLGLHAVVGIAKSRNLQDGRKVNQLKRRGEKVWIEGYAEPVTISWVWLKRDGGMEQRFVLSTKAMSGTQIIRWGKRRWSIEGFFKTAKHRFGLHVFGQQTRHGVYRWIVLSFIAFLLAHWGHAAIAGKQVVDWALAARLTMENFFQELVVLKLFFHIRKAQSTLRACGLKISVQRCNM
jgi:hypothetical protein